VKLSIIITSFNRCEKLETLLEDITTQHRRLRSSEASEVELILIDNNSFDETNEIAYRFIENTGLSIKFFTENQLGISNARNLAIGKASGDLLAFLHDDINLDDDWLKEVYKIACNCHEHEIGVYGGRSIPMWQDSFPDWLHLEPPYGIDQAVFNGHSYGDIEQHYPFESEFGIARVPNGINVLVRKEVFENCGTFRTDLGASASGGFGLGEDIEFFNYLETLKIPIIYSPQIIVFHPVDPSHMTIQSIRRWYFKSARARYWAAFTDRMGREPNSLYGIEPKHRKWVPSFLKEKVSGVPLFLYAKFTLLVMRWLISHLTVGAKKRHWLSYKISETMGEIEAAGLIQERYSSRKFSFKERLVKKGIARG